MNRISALLTFVCVSFLLAPLPATAVITIAIDTVSVGNVGNANDPQDGDDSHTGVQNFGAVSYAYSIGKYEVTVGQYAAFLNAVAATDTYALYKTSMASDLNIAGIARTGSSGSYSYSVIGSANKPIAYVNWGDAARFANWLHNGQPTGLQDSSTTENGAYPLNGATTIAALNAVSRTPSARWFIPTENEWYKAAFHQPAAQGGDADNYWFYTTRTNSEPYSDQAPGAPSIQNNVANILRNDSLANGYNDGYAVTGGTSILSGTNYLTEVGAYTSAPGPYGTFDQGGNLWEWNEAKPSSQTRGVRGGSWKSNTNAMQSLHRSDVSSPDSEIPIVGFRVASIPEPSSLALAVMAGVFGFALVKWRQSGNQSPT